MNLIDIIGDTRRDLELSKAEVSRRSGLSQPTIHGLEQGRGHIRSVQSLLPVLGLKWAWHQTDGEQHDGRSLSRIRQDARISQRNMAALAGVSLPTVQSLETSFSGGFDTLTRIITVLGYNSPLERSEGANSDNSRRLVPTKNAPSQDRVFTPRGLAAKIIDHFEPSMDGTILDPCKGDGSFYDQFPARLERRWCEIDQGRDFLLWQESVDWVVSNPPWSKFRAFLNHSMKISDNIVFLCALTHLSTKARISDIRREGFGMRSILFVPTPTTWPNSGFQMASFWLAKGWTSPCEMHHLD